MTDSFPNDQDLGLFFLMHRAIREDLESFARAVSKLGPEDPPKLERWLTFIERTIRKHHEAEDAWVYPTLAEREPAFAAARAKLEADHQGLDPELVAIRSALAALSTSRSFSEDRARLAARTRAFADSMRDHLDDEEAAILPLMKRHLRKEELDAFERTNAKETSMGEMAIVLPWLLDFADEAQRAQLDAILPWPVKLLYRWSWRSRYERFVAPLRTMGAAA